MSNNKYKFELPACAENISTVRLTTSSIASRLDFDLDTIEDIKVCISEVCNMAINSGAKIIKIDYEINGALEIDVRATGTNTTIVNTANTMAKMILKALNEQVEFHEDCVTLKFEK